MVVRWSPGLDSVLPLDFAWHLLFGLCVVVWISRLDLLRLVVSPASRTRPRSRLERYLECVSLLLHLSSDLQYRCWRGLVLERLGRFLRDEERHPEVQTREGATVVVIRPHLFAGISVKRCKECIWLSRRSFGPEYLLRSFLKKVHGPT